MHFDDIIELIQIFCDIESLFIKAIKQEEQQKNSSAVADEQPKSQFLWNCPLSSQKFKDKIRHILTKQFWKQSKYTAEV